MEFRTQVTIDKPSFLIEPCEEILFVGSCFADAIGQRFREEAFPVIANPFGVMYNPASILHTLQRLATTTPAASAMGPRVVFLTLGTNHIYRLKETGEIVDNCEKRPQVLFQEEELTVDQCANYLSQAVSVLRQLRPDVHIVFTVSPIRYRKYGYHESQLSKATLLLAVQQVLSTIPAVSLAGSMSYFPAYEIVMDELRDYRFYADDLLHPTPLAQRIIFERLIESCADKDTQRLLGQYQMLHNMESHRPINTDSDEYRCFEAKLTELRNEIKNNHIQ